VVSCRSESPLDGGRASPPTICSIKRASSRTLTNILTPHRFPLASTYIGIAASSTIQPLSLFLKRDISLCICLVVSFVHYTSGRPDSYDLNDLSVLRPTTSATRTLTTHYDDTRLLRAAKVPAILAWYICSLRSHGLVLSTITWFFATAERHRFDDAPLRQCPGQVHLNHDRLC
jgi:hypothetical protein